MNNWKKYRYSKKKKCKDCGKLISNYAIYCSSCKQKEKRNHAWKDGRTLNQKEYQRKYRKNHLKQFQEYNKKSYNKHKKELSNKWKIKRQTDLNFKLKQYLRNQLNRTLKNKYKKTSISKLIGCSTIQLKKYLESKFKKGMNWDNYGNGWYGKGNKEWNIDHIKPCCSFDLRKKSEQYKCFHYNNLQPLWAKDNLSKARGKWKKKKGYV